MFDLLLHGFLRVSPAPPKSTRPTRERHLDLLLHGLLQTFLHDPPRVLFDPLLHGLLRGVSVPTPRTSTRPTRLERHF